MGRHINTPVMRILDVSTSHITEGDAQSLETLSRDDGAPFRIMRDEYGFLVSTIEDGEDTAYGLSKAFWDITNTAMNNGYDYVMFDADGFIHADWEVFDW
jgi:hypothetical protein